MFGDRIDEKMEQVGCAIDRKPERRGAPFSRPEAQYEDAASGCDATFIAVRECVDR